MCRLLEFWRQPPLERRTHRHQSSLPHHIDRHHQQCLVMMYRLSFPILWALLLNGIVFLRTFSLGTVVLAENIDVATHHHRHDPRQLLINLKSWVLENGGIVDSRQDILLEDEDASRPPQMYATSYIRAGTILLEVPWHLIVHPDDPEDHDLCELVRVTQRELQTDTPYARYLHSVLLRTDQPSSLGQRHTPSGWSSWGQRMFRIILGDYWLPRQIDATAQWWQVWCGTNSNSNGNTAIPTMQHNDEAWQTALLVSTRRSPGLHHPASNKDSTQSVMIPLFDLYTHRDPPYYNTEISNAAIGESFQLRASENIVAGQPIHVSLGFGKQPVGMHTVLMNHGIVEDYPRRFELLPIQINNNHGDKRMETIVFDVDVTQDSIWRGVADAHNLRHVIKWRRQPSKMALQLLWNELGRLESLSTYTMDPELQTRVPSYEQRIIWRYHEALVEGIRLALATEGKASVSPWTMMDLNVNGLNLAQYQLASSGEEDERHSNEQLFELFEDFDIGKSVSGDETWEELLAYRQVLERPTLSFYGDKIARKRWVPSIGIDQPKPYILRYGSELSGRLQEDAHALLEMLPERTDYCAKPTHHSGGSGVWLVSFDRDTNETSVSSTIREVRPDSQFRHSTVAESLSRNLRAEPFLFESWALKNVEGGVVVEERFVDVDHPSCTAVEFQLYTMWGVFWGGQMNLVRKQDRLYGGFFYRNGTVAHGFENFQLPDYVDWERLVALTERFGANKDMFRADFFVGVSANSPVMRRKNASRAERIKEVRYVYSESAFHPTPVFHTPELNHEAARLWKSGYAMLNYRLVPNSEVPTEFVETGALSELKVVESREIDRETECPE